MNPIKNQPPILFNQKEIKEQPDNKESKVQSQARSILGRRDQPELSHASSCEPPPKKKTYSKEIDLIHKAHKHCPSGLEDRIDKNALISAIQTDNVELFREIIDL